MTLESVLYIVYVVNKSSLSLILNNQSISLDESLIGEARQILQGNDWEKIKESLPQVLHDLQQDKSLIVLEITIIRINERPKAQHRIYRYERE